jgi:hypothetical protein
VHRWEVRPTLGASTKTSSCGQLSSRLRANHARETEVRRSAGAVQRFKQIAEGLEPLIPGQRRRTLACFIFGQRGRLPSTGAHSRNVLDFQGGLGIGVGAARLVQRERATVKV